jgi:hypothetical protein
MTEPDLGNQPLKAGPIGRGGAGASEIIINHLHPFARPAELQRALDQGVLQAGRLLVVFELPQRRLPDVDDGQAIAMVPLHLLRQEHRALHCQMGTGHDRDPPQREHAREGDGEGD